MTKTRSAIALAVTACALVASGATAAVPLCPAYTDDAGDGEFGEPGLFTQPNDDAALDIRRVSHKVANGVLTLGVTVTSLGAPDSAEGAEYSAGFVVDGKQVMLFGTKSLTHPVMDVGFAMKGITVDGSYVSGSEPQVNVVENAAANTFSLSAKLSDLGAAAGKKLEGLTVTGLKAETRGTYVVLLSPNDAAESAGMKLPMNCR